jgi:hypothetical protein
VNALSQPTAALAAGSQFTDFRLTGEPIKNLCLKVEVDLSNASVAGSFTAKDTFNMFSHLEVLSENSSLNVMRIDSDHLYQGLSELDRDTYFTMVRALTDNSTAFTTTSTGTATLYVPLFKCFLQDPNYIMPSGLTNHLLIRVWWRGGCTYSVKGLEVNSVSLLMQCFHYDASVRQKMMSKYLSSKFDFRFANPKVMKTMETITYNTRHQIRLSAFNGLVTSLTVIARIAGVTTPISKVELLDPQNMSLSGGAPLDFEYVDRVLRASENRFIVTPGDTAEETDLWFHYPIGGENQALSNHHGQLNGYIPMSSLHQIAIYIENASNTTVSAEISILYDSVSTFTVNKGITTVSHS